MLQQIIKTTTIASPRVGRDALGVISGQRLQLLLKRVRLRLVEFTAMDVHTICSLCVSGDSLNLSNDPEFIRGIYHAFEESDQSILTSLQVNQCIETFLRAGIRVAPKAVTLPEDEEAISAEALLNVLQGMLNQRVRDDRQLTQIVQRIPAHLEDLSPSQIPQVMKCLSMLKTTDTNLMGKLAHRVAGVKDDLSSLDIAVAAASAGFTRGVPHSAMLAVLSVVEDRASELRQDDVALILQGLTSAGPRYKKTLQALAEGVLDQVESLDVNSIGWFMAAFVRCEYKQRAHMEIIVDAVVEKASEIEERLLVHSFEAIHQLDLMSQPIFSALSLRATILSPRLDPRSLSSLVDICGQVPFDSEELMSRLLLRFSQCYRSLNGHHLGIMLDGIGTYPPAKEQVQLIDALGKHCLHRMDMLGPEPLANCTRGLASLGYSQSDYYMAAAQTHLRWGFKDFVVLEPILLGLTHCVGQGVAPEPRLVRVLASHLTGMCPRLSLPEVERAHAYMLRLQHEDERVFKALAKRIRVFTREITSDMPIELQQLLQRIPYEETEKTERQMGVPEGGQGF